jgi:hypothetical protein
MNHTPTKAGTAPKYPKITVKLLGKDVIITPLSILGKVAAAMDKAGVPQSEVDGFMHAAMSHDHDHDHLLRTVMSWVMVR